ncbi:hypothetical protein [Burkholderia ubonensis]|uniref:hypothetical protein n=1 Tax=Burkholderia ubonensis TaxID=101571 RepID=UPI000ADAE1C3|nr:hypothetical protein [Burkholderia ubonensis]
MPGIDQAVAQINRSRRDQTTVRILLRQSAGESMIDIANQSDDRLYDVHAY